MPGASGVFIVALKAAAPQGFVRLRRFAGWPGSKQALYIYLGHNIQGSKRGL